MRNTRYGLELQAMRATFNRTLRSEWVKRWSSSERGQRYARLDRTPPSAKVLRSCEGLKRDEQALLTQLRTGHVALNSYLRRIHVLDSPNCQVCNEPESVDHFLLRCRRFIVPPQDMRSKLRGQVLSLRSLLGCRQNFPALMNYIKATGRFAVSGLSSPPPSQP